MPAQGDVAAVARPPLVYTDVATFVLIVLTLLGAGVPLVSAGVATFSPVFIRTVAGSVTLGVYGVGGTSLGTIVVTRL